MSRSILIHHFLFSLLIVFLALNPLHARADAPIPLTTVSNPQLPNNTNLDTINNTTLTGDPPIKVVMVDSTHTIYFTKYRHLLPERNYFASLVSIQTSLMAQYFQRRVETMLPHDVDYSVFGVRIYLGNPTQQLTYALAHRLFGELGEFLMQQGVCTARFEMWEISGGGGKQLSVGFIAPKGRAEDVA